MAEAKKQQKEAEKELLNDEELDKVTGGSLADCNHVLNKLREFGVNNLDDVKKLAKAAYNDQGIYNIEIHWDTTDAKYARNPEWYGNWYKTNLQVVDQEDFLNTLVAYAKKNNYHA